MIQNYTFNKKIKKTGDYFQLEIILPNNFNNIEYKIYGDEGFVHYGLYKSIKNVSLDNILIIIINKIQNLFINIKTINDDIEYFDFLNNYDNNDTLKKNIKMDIKRKVNIIDDQTNTYLDNIINDEKDVLEKDTNNSKKSISSHDLFNYFVKKNNESSDDEDDDDDEEDEDEEEEDAESDKEDEKKYND